MDKKLPWNWTIFAPSDKAFENASSLVKQEILEDEFFSKNIFMDHIMTGHKTSLDVNEEITVEITVSNKPIQIYKSKKLYVKDLISKRFDITEAKRAYQLLKSSESVIGILFQYKNFPAKDNKSIKFKDLIENKSALEISVIGSGNYAKRVILPILSKKDINLQTIFSRSGLESTLMAKKYNFKESSTDLDKVWNDDKTNTSR